LRKTKNLKDLDAFDLITMIHEPICIVFMLQYSQYDYYKNV